MTFRIKNHKNIVYKVQQKVFWIFWDDCMIDGRHLAWFLEYEDAKNYKDELEAFYNFISLTERKENSLK